MGIQEITTRLLKNMIPDTVYCDTVAFPSHIPRWKTIDGTRIPIVDKDGTITSALRSKLIVGHGSIIDVVKVMDEDMNEGELSSSSSAVTSGDTAVEIIFDDNDNNDRKDYSSSSVLITM